MFVKYSMYHNTIVWILAAKSVLFYHRCELKPVANARIQVTSCVSKVCVSHRALNGHHLSGIYWPTQDKTNSKTFNSIRIFIRKCLVEVGLGLPNLKP